jgi:ABC-type lipoprotein export system ATPase subunit
VDKRSAIVITDFLGALRDEGKTILISTHAANLAKLNDKTYFMKENKLLKTA